MAVDKLLLNDFSGGLVTDNPPYAINPNEFREINGTYPRFRGSLRLRPGMRSLLSISTHIYGFTRFFDDTATYIVYATSDMTTSALVYAYNETSHTTTKIFPAPASSFDSFDNNIPVVQFAGRVFFPDGLGPLFSWDGTTLSTVGQAAPIDPAAVAITAVGNLNTNNLLGVKYVYTYVDSNGVESNPSPDSPYVQGGTANFGVDLTISAVDPLLNPDIQTINIYRTGGLLSQFTQVGSTVNTGGTITYNDQLGDAGVGVIVCSFSHDVPPTGIELMVVAKNRLVVSKGYTLYVSNLGIPDYFPSIITFPLTDGIQFRIDPDIKNPITSLTTVGSSVLIGRRRNIYLLQGNDFDSWSLTKVCDIGVIAPRSMVQCGNQSIWLAPDGMVYALGEDQVQPLALPVLNVLEGIDKTILPKACACYFRRQYHICIPNGASVGHPIYYLFDFTYNRWFDMSQQYTNVTQMYSETGQTDLDEILMSTDDAGFVLPLPSGTSFHGLVAQFSYDTTPPGFFQNMNLDFYSGDMDFGKPSWIKEVKTIRIRGKCTPYSNTNVTVTIYAVLDHKDGTTTTASKSYNLNALATSGVLIDTDVTQSLAGHRISYEIAGIASVFEMDDLEIGYALTREGRF